MDWNEVRQSMTNIGIETFGSSPNQSKIFLPKTGGSVPIDGIFTRAWVEVKNGPGIPISAMQSVLDINLSQLPARPVNGDKVSVDSVEYRIIDCQEDGDGGARLVLQKS